MPLCINTDGNIFARCREKKQREKEEEKKKR